MLKTSAEKINIIFQPSGRRGQIKKGQTILEAAQELGVEITSLCGGKQICGKCRIKVEWGSVSPFSAEEKKFISPKEAEEGIRLACVGKIGSDALITIPWPSPLQHTYTPKNFLNLAGQFNPAVQSFYVEIIPPTLKTSRSDWQSLQESLDQFHGLKNLTIDFWALKNLSGQLRQEEGKLTALVSLDREIVALQPGKKENYYGLALDIGTTTLALYLGHLKEGRIIAANSILNPQVIFGEDIMSRFHYVLERGDEGLKNLTRKLREGINELITTVAKSATISPTEIVEMVVVGNTAMHHLFLGLNPQYLSLAPFAPVIHQSLYLKARELGITINPGANVYILPIEAGFVGADNVGVLIAQEPYNQEEISLIIDVGTNGEILLGNKYKLLSASCATGPAFEGTHIKFGMRAAPGAIERVRLDPASGQVNFRVIGSEKWSQDCPPGEIKARGICGSGIIEAVAEMVKAEVIEKSGRFNRDRSVWSKRWNEKGEFIIARAEETAFNQDITICLEDIRAVQLAKGALYAGSKILMKIMEVEKPDKVILAGGFGSTINPERAMLLGMFPECDLRNVHPVGNAAGMGACLALFNREKRKEAEEMARRVKYIELSTHPEFQEEFIKALSFPSPPSVALGK